jgi:hypothetical protein
MSEEHQLKGKNNMPKKTGYQRRIDAYLKVSLALRAKRTKLLPHFGTPAVHTS